MKTQLLPLRMPTFLCVGCFFFLATGSCSGQETKPNMDTKDSFSIQKSEEAWRQELTPSQYSILREKGTEAPFSGKFYNHTEIGMYSCAGCGSQLFSSDSKFHSGCGWPSYFEPVREGSIVEKPDYSHNMVRTEILCGKCGSHLGHVFNDGPPPTGLRYCINSESLQFTKENIETK